MLEFETFVYLDVQKTGTTFINAFLQEFCSGRPTRSRRNH